MRAPALALAVLGAAGVACTTFAFPAPSPVADASTPVDAAEAGAQSTSFLDVPTAGSLCSLILSCPGLGPAIEQVLAIPVATPASPLNYSACLDWLAGPIDPARPGLATQRQVLSNIAASAICQDAYGASPAHPIDAGAGCAGSTCAAANELQVCSSAAGAFTVVCAAPVFAAAGFCSDLTGFGAVCVSAPASGSCTAGVSCNGDVLQVCYPPKGDALTSYDCTLSGRRCVNAGSASCVVPGTLSPPCAARTSPQDTCTSDSSTVLHCVSDLSQTALACGPAGRKCSTASGVARCVGPTDACTPFDTGGKVNTCLDGTHLGACVGGQPLTLDCASLQGRACLPADATRTARCG